MFNSTSNPQELHRYADKDSGPMSLHHTLGVGVHQASPGDHSHDGGTSRLLLDGITLTGAKGGSAFNSSIVAALVALGATDNTTA